MKKNNILHIALMHAGFFLYSGYAILGKLASKEEFLSLNFFALYGCVFVLLGFYAIIWQQVLKHFSLVTAVANKTITISKLNNSNIDFRVEREAGNDILKVENLTKKGFFEKSGFETGLQ